MSRERVFKWEDPAPPTIAVLCLMAFDIVRSLAQFSIKAIWGPGSDYGSIDLTGSSAPQRVLSVVDGLGLVSLVGLIFVVRWLLRVSRNAHVLKNADLKNSPWFTALWWYLIPFMSIFKPFTSLGEVWDESIPRGQTVKYNRAALPVWWVATLAVVASARLVYMSEYDMTFVGLNTVASLVQCVTFGYIATRICAMQIDKRMALAFDDPQPPIGVLQRLNS